MKNHMTCLKIPNGVIKSRKSKHRQTKKIKTPNNDLQNIIQKTKDDATRTPLKPVSAWYNNNLKYLKIMSSDE
jgi:hypothetical protein